VKHFVIASLLLSSVPALAQTPQPAQSPPPPAAASAEAEPAPLTPAEALKLVAELDDRQRNSGDYRTNVYIERKERNKNDVVFDATVFRRDADDKLMILFQAPKSEKGKGYLRVDKNLWMYDPTTGKWERRTEREKIGGTDSRRADFDESRLAEEYTIKYEKADKLGTKWTHKLTLTLKKGVDAAYAQLVLWLSTESGNTLKKQEYAESGKLMRTTYTPKWVKKFSPSKAERYGKDKGDVWTPKEIRIFDEVEKGNSTTILLKEQDLNSLPANLFTKAWLESQSR
jgi:outer membrane lipoprotein-sorting protein